MQALIDHIAADPGGIVVGALFCIAVVRAVDWLERNSKGSGWAGR